MNNLLIHNNNVAFLESFDASVKFIASSGIDDYISNIILPQIKDKTPNIIFIKDNLSSNYLELYGLRLAYHIRFEESLKLLPIVILSDIDGFTLNKLEPMAKILFTQNVFIIPNTKKAVDNFQTEHIKPFSEDAYKTKFLDRITVEPPENSSSHSIANEWAIDRWAEFLKIESDAVDNNRAKISSMLYFKYLVALNPLEKDRSLGIKKPKLEGKVLYIDDEWDRGWSDILESYFPTNILFETFEKNFKDSNIYTLQTEIKNRVIKSNPDVILLDLRLSSKDTDRTDIENFTGIKVREIIKKINPAIQVIMFTATSKSRILEELYKHKILGYIKKEDPKERNIKTKENFIKLSELVDLGLGKKWLKEVWETQKDILKLNILHDDEFKEMKFEIESIFEVLDSDMNNKLNYAIFTIFKCIEIISYLYVEEKDRKSYWNNSEEIINDTGYYKYRRTIETSNLEHIKNENNKSYSNQGNISVENKIRTIMREKLDITLDELHSQIKCIVCVRNHLMHSDKEYEEKDFCKRIIEIEPTKDNILTWFKMLKTILEKIDKDAK